MKFQVKALVAALALAAAGSANAAIEQNASGNSSMILSVFDRVANVSAQFDLGKSYSDFNLIGTSFSATNIADKGQLLSWDLTSGDYATAWSTFLGLTGGTSNLIWGVLAGDNLGNGAGQRGIISTLNQPTVTSMVTNQITNQLGTFDNYSSNSEVASAMVYSNHADVDNGGSVGNAGFGNVLTWYGNNQNNRAGSVAAGTIGSTLRVYQQVGAATNFAAGTSIIYGNDATFTLSNAGQLVYSTTPVPEADTWAMMLLGLGFMGFAARRKQA